MPGLKAALKTAEELQKIVRDEKEQWRRRGKETRLTYKVMPLQSVILPRIAYENNVFVVFQALEDEETTQLAEISEEMRELQEKINRCQERQRKCVARKANYTRELKVSTWHIIHAVNSFLDWL